MSLLLANLFLWVYSSLLDSDEFTATTRETLDEPRVEQRMAEVVAAEIVASTDLTDRVMARLPAEVAFAEVIVASQLEDALETITRRILESELASTVGDELIRRLHAAVMAVLRNDDGLLEVEGSELVLDLRPVFDRVFDRLGITPPERLQSEDRGRVVVLEDTTGLRGASFLVTNAQAITIALFVVAIGLFALAVWVRRPAIGIGAGYAVLVVGLIGLTLVFLGNQSIESLAGERVVAAELIKSHVSEFRLQSGLLVVLGACVVAVSDKRISGRLQAFEARASSGIARWTGRIGVSPTLLGAVALLAFMLLVV